MSGRLLAVQTALLSLLFPYMPGMKQSCPWLVNEPVMRADVEPHDLITRLQQEVQQLDHADGADLIFYGDSITELWRGTDMGRSSPRTQGALEVFQAFFGSKFRSNVLAVGGDQVSHLHWRLLNGNLPSAHPPAVVVIQIGINDILMGQTCWPDNVPATIAVGNATAYRAVRMLADVLERLSNTQVLLLGILPAGDWSDTVSQYRWPNALTPGITSANFWLAKAAEREERLTYLDCSGPFLATGQINPAAQPDGLHPGNQGFELLARCMELPVQELMASQGVAVAARGDAQQSLPMPLNEPSADRFKAASPYDGAEEGLVPADEVFQGHKGRNSRVAIRRHRPSSNRPRGRRRA